jgi:hypothetical protein
MIIFLDDSVERQKSFRSEHPSAMICSTASEGIDEIIHSQMQFNSYVPKEEREDIILCLDHDLGGEQDTDSSLQNSGMEVVRWVIKNKPSINKIIVHSSNWVAAEEMCHKLEDAGYNVGKISYITFKSMGFPL